MSALLYKRPTFRLVLHQDMICLNYTFSARRQPATSVTFESPEPDNPTWAKLEELIRMESDSNSNQFRPSLQHYTNQTNNSANPVAIVGGEQ